MKKPLPVISIPYHRGIHIAQPEQIVRVQAISNYSKVYFANGYPVTVAKVLRWFQQQLPQEMFSRVHRSHLVNKMFITHVVNKKQSTIQMSNGETINISRRKKAMLTLKT